MCVEEDQVEGIVAGWLFGSFLSVFPFDLYMSWKALAGYLALRVGPSLKNAGVPLGGPQDLRPVLEFSLAYH